MSDFLPGETVDVFIQDNRIFIKGIYAKTLLKDLSRIYNFSEENGTLLFDFVTSGFIFQRVTVNFHRFFSLEVYDMFGKLYRITKRSVYKEVVELLPKIDDKLSNYLSPDIPLPSHYKDELEQLKKITLENYQEAFLENYYNATQRLKLHGYILAFEAGLGKTYTAIATTHVFDLTPTIITCPLSVFPSWVNSITKLIPRLRMGEVQTINEYDPTVKWKYMICNYEKLAAAQQAAKTACGIPKSLLIDESHNFRYMTTQRTQNLINLKTSFNIENVIAISGTPIKALASELIPIMMLIDPQFDDKARHIFNRLYSKQGYSLLASSVLKRRLSLYIERKKQEDVLELPSKSEYTVRVKVDDMERYYIENIKKEISKYIDENVPIEAKQQMPRYATLISMIEKLSGATKEEKDDYLNLVRIKIEHPMREDIIVISEKIKSYEKMFKQLDPDLGKEIVSTRKLCTSYMQVILGRAMGQFYVKNKIDLITKMATQNIGDVVKILKTAEKKSLIFSTYLEPLQKTSEILTKQKVGNILVSGGMDSKEIIKEFRDRNDIEVLLGTTGSIGTGTDGLQFIADVMIFLNQPYRHTDTQQCVARLFRKGQDTPVKIYYMLLNTKEHNILEHEQEINDWSRRMFKAAMD